MSDGRALSRQPQKELVRWRHLACIYAVATSALVDSHRLPADSLHNACHDRSAPAPGGGAVLFPSPALPHPCLSAPQSGMQCQAEQGQGRPEQPREPGAGQRSAACAAARRRPAARRATEAADLGWRLVGAPRPAANRPVAQAGHAGWLQLFFTSCSSGRSRRRHLRLPSLTHLLSTPPSLALQPGTRGEYLDAEKLTRDPLELNVGSRTAIGDSLSLPEAPRPVVARTLAVVAAAAGLAFSLGLAPPLLSAGTASVALDGATWRLATAALQPVSLLNTCATVAALASCGQLAEKRLGSVLFAATFAAAGAASAICWYGASAASLQEGGALVAGASAALLGPAAALAGPYLLGNWSVLSGAQRGGCGAAALGLAAVWLTEAGLSVTGTPLDEVLSTPIHGVAAAVGLTLGAAAGPQLQVQREVRATGPISSSLVAR